MTGKTLLIICGGVETVHGVRLAQAMGHHVVVSDWAPDAPGMKLADDTLIASTYDLLETVSAAKQYHHNVRPIDGVMCIGSDVPLTVACVAAALGLPGISVKSATIAQDKLAMKDAFREAGVPIPFYAPVPDVAALRALMQEHGLHMVLKPVDSRGSRGVIRMDGDTDVDWAFETSKANSPTGRVMIEEYLAGPQVSTESIVIDGVCHTPGFSDRNYEYLDRYAPWFIENGGDLPSHLPADVQEDVRDVVGRAAAAMGIANGNVKGDIVVSGGKAHVIELAARLSGGYFCTLEIPLNTGVDFVGAVIRQALGEPIDPEDLKPKFLRPTVQRYIFPDPGKIVAIQGVEEARKVPGIEEIMVSWAVGEIIPETSNTTARAVMLIATGDTMEAAKASVAEAIDRITIKVEPVA